MSTFDILGGLYLLVAIVGSTSLIISFLSIYFDAKLGTKICGIICAFLVAALSIVIIAISETPMVGESINVVFWILIGFIQLARLKKKD